MKLFNDAHELDKIRETIVGLRNSEEPFLIKKGALAHDRNWWINFFKNECRLKHDKRHYSAQEKLEIADWWEVSFQPDKATSYAYSKTRQPLHTDNAWFSDPAEINLFIMEKQSIQGGEQSIYPLTRLMNDLQSDEPGLFHDLTNVVVTIKKGDGDYFNKTSIINLGNNDPKIFWNYYRVERSSKEIEEMCEKFFKYLEKRESTSSVYYLATSTGDCFGFNDLKLLHGRTAFEAKEAFDRILIQSMWKV